MPSPVFFDVDASDAHHVNSRFPDALFLPADADPVKECASAEVISTFITTPFPRTTIESLPKLKLLCTRSVGIDHIDAAACAEKGIIVCHVPDYGAHVIAEHGFALLLSAIRRIREGHDRMRSCVCDYRGLRGMALQGKTLGIIGTGKIGRHMATIAKGFGMRLLAFDLFPIPELEQTHGLTYMELDDLLAESDVITLHLPATKETYHMLNAKTIAGMKEGAVVVNTARGALVDEAALVDALDGGKLSFVCTDVVENEHALEKHAALLKHPKVIATPHIAFYADDSVRTMYLDCLRSIDEWMAGKRPMHAVG